MTCAEYLGNGWEWDDRDDRDDGDENFQSYGLAHSHPTFSSNF